MNSGKLLVVRPYKPEKIYLEKAARDYSLTVSILNRLPGIPVQEIVDVRSLVVGGRLHEIWFLFF